MHSSLASLAVFAAGAPAEGGGNPLLRIEPGLWIWTLIIFLGLLLILWRFGWGMMIGNLDARDRAIRGSIDQARKEREEAAQLLAEHKQLVDKARHETAAMLEDARQSASKERQRIVDEARSESEKIVARGREQIEQEKRAAMSEIRKTVADLAIDVSKKLVPSAIDPSTHRSLAEQFVQQLERQD